MSEEAFSYEDLMRNQWNPMTAGRAGMLRAELRDWRENRQAGGYDVRLIEGAIAVCDAYIRRAGNTKDVKEE